MARMKVRVSEFEDMSILGGQITIAMKFELEGQAIISQHFERVPYTSGYSLDSGRSEGYGWNAHNNFQLGLWHDITVYHEGTLILHLEINYMYLVTELKSANPEHFRPIMDDSIQRLTKTYLELVKGHELECLGLTLRPDYGFEGLREFLCTGLN